MDHDEFALQIWEDDGGALGRLDASLAGKDHTAELVLAKPFCSMRQENNSPLPRREHKFRGVTP
jgi:hypothetical protein